MAMDDLSDRPSKIDYSPAQATVEAEQLRRRAGQKMPAPHTLKKEEWPPNYGQVLAWRATELARYEADPKRLRKAKAYYRNHPVAFINHWCDTYDPRKLASGKPVWMPFILFERQAQMVDYVMACIKAETPGLIEKARDMGATWVGCALSVSLWLFWTGSAIGWGSNKQEKVDRLGDPSSIFEKIRMLIERLPECFKPDVNRNDHLFHMRCLNPDNGATIIGEIGDNIGRGARTLIYFVDEAAHLDHPEQVEASLSETTRVRMDLSSVSGLGTVFHRKRESGVDWTPEVPIKRGELPVFVFDWSDHPEKTKAWHDERKLEWQRKGLPHVFARETDRDYAAAVEGVIIPADWVLAAIDAHIKLEWDPPSGPHIGGLDVADEGLDRNALVLRQSYFLRSAEEWGERDTGATARRAVVTCRQFVPCSLQYDSIGVGAGVKSETNRLVDDGLLPKGLSMVPWAASAKVLEPFQNVIPDDKDSPKNRDFYQNLKAQAWWQLRGRFERTYRAVTEGLEYDLDTLISIPSELPLLRQLQKELSQATAKRATSTLKLVVDKTPEGARSPNIADGAVMAFWPWVGPRQPVISIAAPRVLRPIQ